MKKLLGLLAIFLFFYLFFFDTERLNHYASYPLYPIMRTYSFIDSTCKKIKTFFTSKDELTNEYTQIKNELNLLKSYTTTLENMYLSAECESHKNSSDAKIYDCPVIKSNVLLYRNTPYEKRFIIDKGTSHGVTKDAPVVYGNSLLGKVVEAYPWYSTIMLLTDKKSRISVTSKHGIKGICEGLNEERKLNFSFFQHKINLPFVGKEIILSSGEGKLFPRGFGVGSVVDISNDGSVYTAVTLESIYDFSKIDTCYVLQHEKELIPDSPTCLSTIGFLNLENYVQKLRSECDTLLKMKHKLLDQSSENTYSMNDFAMEKTQYIDPSCFDIPTPPNV